MNPSTADLWTRRLTARGTCLAFAVAFLTAHFAAADGWTALTRGVIAAAAARLFLPILVLPVVNTVIDAMTRDLAAEQAAGQESSR